MMLVSLCAETIKPVIEGENLTAVEGNASVYQVYAVSRTTTEERTDCSKGWGGGWGSGIPNSFT